MSGKTARWPLAVDSAAAGHQQSQHGALALGLEQQAETSWALLTMAVKPLLVAGWVLARARRVAGSALPVVVEPLIVLHWVWVMEAGVMRPWMVLC